MNSQTKPVKKHINRAPSNWSNKNKQEKVNKHIGQEKANVPSEKVNAPSEKANVPSEKINKHIEHEKRITQLEGTMSNLSERIIELVQNQQNIIDIISKLAEELEKK